ncbi:hypothetical protein N7507_003091 [Penicillium longicatenatum]|nr:hypothetical protein N7507_003091 [Penicillium longicatenatum]
MSSLFPLPIVACVLNNEAMIHSIQALETAKQKIPNLLAGKNPKSPDINISGKDNRTIRGVIFGPGFVLEEVMRLREKCAGIAPEPVIWIVSQAKPVPQSTF